MTLTKKFSAIAAVLVIGVLSIYATTLNFLTTNKTAQSVNVTLNTQLGAQYYMTLAPGQQIPTVLDNDQVLSLTIYGAIVPAGANAIVPNPSGGTVIVRWTNGPTGSQAAEVDPNEIS
jgi:hypothetical protein